MSDNILKDSVPPHNLDAEKATLGAMLMNWEAAGEIVTLLVSQDFYLKQHQVIYSAMLDLFSRGTQGDSLALVARLTEKGELENAGGASYIASLTGVVSTTANIRYYAEIVHNYSIRRSLIKISSEIKSDSFNETKDTRTVLDDAEKKIFSISDKNSTIDIFDMTTIMNRAFIAVENNMKRKAEYTGIPSGLTKLDTYTSGFQNSELIIIGARPSMGKTALALSFMENISVTNQIPCGFFSLEMPSSMIGQRLLSQVSGIPGYKLKSGRLTSTELKSIQDACGKCYTAPLYVVDEPNMKLIDLKAMSRRMVAKYGVKIIFIDYIGLISVENQNAKVFEQVSEITKSLKSLARELNIPIVALCQVSRDAENEKPNLAQLRGSGSVEQDADVVMFIHRERKQTDESSPSIESELILAKQRNGAIGDIKMLFFPALTKFVNLVEDNQ